MSHDGEVPVQRENALVPSDPLLVPAVTRFGTPIPGGYPEMVDQLRLLLDRLTAAVPPTGLVQEIAKAAEGFSARLLSHEVPEEEQVAGRLSSIPGRGQLLSPAYDIDHVGDQSMTGRVRFGRRYLGSNGAVHGGVIPLVFDEVLGRLAIVGGRPRSRTAFLHVDYRSITPVDEDLQLEGWIEREEGRKHFLRGVLRHGDRVCAEAKALFVALRPGQP